MSFKTVYRDEILGINWSLSGIDTWELLLKGKYLVYFIGSPYKSLSICIASSFLLFLLIDSRIEGLIDREDIERQTDKAYIIQTCMHIQLQSRTIVPMHSSQTMEQDGLNQKQKMLIYYISGFCFYLNMIQQLFIVFFTLTIR